MASKFRDTTEAGFQVCIAEILNDKIGGWVSDNETVVWCEWDLQGVCLTDDSDINLVENNNEN